MSALKGVCLTVVSALRELSELPSSVMYYIFMAIVLVSTRTDPDQHNYYLVPGVPTTMWHVFLSIFLFSSTGSPPMNTWQTMLSICEPIADITSLIWTAISLVGAKISTYNLMKKTY